MAETYYRKVIRIKATDSPNVRYALAEQALGRKPSGHMLVPGVLPYADYQMRRATWDRIRQCIGLDAQFYEGEEVLLFPPTWLNRAEELAERFGGFRRQAKAIGIDPAEGGDKTSMAAVDEYGLIELVSKKTPDTSVIVGEAVAFFKKHGVDPRCVFFDRGGGGKQRADDLRKMGYKVQTVSFAESLVPSLKPGTTTLTEKIDVQESRFEYVNRRAQMYGLLHELLDPARADIERQRTGHAPVIPGFALPKCYHELRRQLAMIPKTYDSEGRLYLLPKNSRRPGSGEKTLVQLIGHSPDEADALVLAVYALHHKRFRVKVGMR